MINHYLGCQRNMIDMAVELHRRGAISIDTSDNKIRPLIHQHKMSNDQRYRLNKILSVLTPQMATTAVWELINLGWAFSEGIHVIELKKDTAEALAHMDLTITAAEYHPPFPGVVIDMDDSLTITTWHPETHAMTIAANPPMRNAPQGMEYMEGVMYWFSMRPDEEIETYVQKISTASGGMYSGEIPADFTRRALRIAINACLYATHRGIDKLPDSNPTHRQRCMDRLKKAERRKNEELIETNKRELNLIPLRYTIEQTLPIFLQEGPERKDSQPTGRHVAPHWRRGHWRRYPIGPDGERKPGKIPIPAVLVNSDFLLGNRSGTVTKMK